MTARATSFSSEPPPAALALFLEQNVALIDRVVVAVCRRVGVAAGDVDDVASAVKLALIENDYAILRRYEGRSSMATYLAIIVRRLLADQYARQHGRWRPSATLPRLPRHVLRPREVMLPDDDAVPAADRADAAMLDRELRALWSRAAPLLRRTMEGWPAEDRLLMRLRFGSSFTIADAARQMRVPQRPLYRRLETLLQRLRGVLLASGIDADTAVALLDASHRIEIDLGMAWQSRASGSYSAGTATS
jgi:RNA polymerase sigma factor (sigma-70 family)